MAPVCPETSSERLVDELELFDYRLQLIEDEPLVVDQPTNPGGAASKLAAVRIAPGLSRPISLLVCHGAVDVGPQTVCVRGVVAAGEVMVLEGLAPDRAETALVTDEATPPTYEGGRLSLTAERAARMTSPQAA